MTPVGGPRDGDGRREEKVTSHGGEDSEDNDGGFEVSVEVEIGRRSEVQT